jgi:clan AA aspartic protease (TIGR02281 family)
MTHGDTPFDPASNAGRPQRLRSPFLKGQQLAYCARCGAGLRGSGCDECGWVAPAKSSLGTGVSHGLVAGSVLGVLALFGGLYGLSRLNLHNWYPDAPKAAEHMRLAHSMYQEGQKQEALLECEQAVYCAPQDGKLHRDFAALLEREGQPEGALQQIALAAQFAPNDQQIQEMNAIMYDRLNHDDNVSMSLYKGVLSKFPNSTVAMFWAARTAERLGDDKAARDFYERQLKFDKSCDGTFCGIARAYQHEGNTAGAVAAYRRGIKALPNSAALHYQLGMLLVDDRTHKVEGIRELKKSIDLDPYSAEWTSALISKLNASKDGTFVMVPLERVGDSFMVNVTINHKKQAKLIVDSGAEVCVISTGLARGLGLNLDNATQVSFQSATGYGTAMQTNLDTVALSHARQDNIPVDVCDLPDTQSADGLLGMSFLKRYKFSLDAEHALLQLQTKESEE